MLITDFEKAVQQDARASYELALQITNQYSQFVQRIGALQYTNAYDRIIYYFLTMAGRFGEKLPNGSVRLVIPLTHSFISCTVNVARETASRCLKRLTDKGLVRSESKFFIIVSVVTLAAELHDSSIDLTAWLS